MAFRQPETVSKRYQKYPSIRRIDETTAHYSLLTANYVSGSLKHLANMLAVIANILFYLRIFNYIVAYKCGQGLHTDKLHCLMQRQIHAINADTAEKFIFIGESGKRCVPCNRKQGLFHEVKSLGLY